MEISNFTVSGMTCQSCVKKISEAVSKISSVNSVSVNLENKNIEISSVEKINLTDVVLALAGQSKYTASVFKPVVKTQIAASSIFITYKPLLILFTYVFFASTAYQLSLEKFQLHLFMNHIMAGFFIGLSFFKFLNLKAFNESFANYDPLAKVFKNYGYLYAFTELALGLMFIAHFQLAVANTITIFILTVTTYGVYKKLQTNSNFICACIGADFKLPLSKVTLFENAIMILMASYGIINY